MAIYPNTSKVGILFQLANPFYSFIGSSSQGVFGNPFSIFDQGKWLSSSDSATYGTTYATKNRLEFSIYGDSLFTPSPSTGVFSTGAASTNVVLSASATGNEDPNSSIS